MDRNVDPQAGKKADSASLITREEMEKRYYSPESELKPVKNGTSGHRGKTGEGFAYSHVAAMTQALAEIRKERGTFGPDLSPDEMKRLSTAPMGPIILGKDVRFTSDCAQRTAVEVFAGNGMNTVVHKGGRATPTPVISHRIISGNKRGENIEGVVITASHNPPEDAGYKSNGYNGGPNTRTAEIDQLSNRFLREPEKVQSLGYDEACKKGAVLEEDLVTPYVEELSKVVKMDIIKGARFGATPLGGAATGYYEAVNGVHGTQIEVVLPDPDPTSALKTRDWDGKLRGDPSSPYVMQAVAGYRDKLGLPFIGANDNDADRFGGEDSTGILNPNHVLCVVADYLMEERGFAPSMGVGRTIGSSHMIDLIAAHHGRGVREVNVGFKWYVQGLINREYVMAGEESAGLSLPRLDGTPWVTEKDGICAVLLMMEIMAAKGKDMGTLYADLVNRFGPHQYERVDTPASPAKKERLVQLAKNPEETRSLLLGKKVAGRSVESMVIGDGVKVVLEGGVWVLKRASGTEDIIKDYREERGESLETVRKASEEIDSLLGLEI